MNVYLAGPITGHESTYRAAFGAVAADLTAQGCTVLNPAELPAGLDYDQYIHIGLAMLDVCDVIYMLAGWQDSSGARRELAAASDAGKMIMGTTYGDLTTGFKFLKGE